MQGRVVPDETIVRETVQPESHRGTVPCRHPESRRGGGAMGMHVTEFLNIEEKLHTSLMLRATYLTRPASFR
jgi:hypothetical protein